jgi:transposase
MSAIDYDAIIREAIELARRAVNDERKQEVENILAWWGHDEDEMIEAIGPKPGEASGSWDRRPKFFPNVMRDVVWRAARIYDRRPRRTITDESRIPDGCRAMLEELWSSELTLAMDQQLDRMTLLLGRLPLRVAWIEDEGRVDWQPFYPDSVDVV